MAVAIQEAPRALLDRETELIPKRTALMFPGQVIPSNDIFSYYEFLRDNNPNTAAYIRIAQEAVELPLQLFLENRAAEALSSDSVRQPIIYTLSVLGFENTMHEQRFEGTMLGHSLGEYAAATAAGLWIFEDGVQIVAERGRLFRSAFGAIDGGMRSVIGLTEEQVREACEGTDVSVSLVNAPRIIVIGGLNSDLSKAEEELRRRNARRIERLDVRGPLHTHYLHEAAVRMQEYVERFPSYNLQSPVVTNRYGQMVRDGELVKRHLIEGIENTVRLADGIESLKTAGVERFIDIGPSDSMTRLTRANNIPDTQISHA